MKFLLALSLLVVDALGAPAATKFLEEASGDLGKLTQAKIDFVKEKGRWDSIGNRRFSWYHAMDYVLN